MNRLKGLSFPRRNVNGGAVFYYLTLGILIFLCVGIFLFVILNMNQEPELVDSRTRYMGAVDELTARGVIVGYTDGSFQADKPISYEEFIKMCVTVHFPDTSPSESGYWVTPFYEIGLKEGYFNKDQVDETLFKADLERINMAFILGNMLDVPITPELLTAYRYVDVDGDSAKGIALAKATHAGVVRGYSDNSFRPYDTVTRADVVMALHRYIAYMERDPETDS